MSDGTRAGAMGGEGPEAGAARAGMTTGGLVLALSMVVLLVVAMVRHDQAAFDARKADVTARCASVGATVHETLVDTLCARQDGVLIALPSKG